MPFELRCLIRNFAVMNLFTSIISMNIIMNTGNILMSISFNKSMLLKNASLFMKNIIPNNISIPAGNSQE